MSQLWDAELCMVLEKEKERNIMAWLVRKQVIRWENALTGTSSKKDSV